MPLVLEAKVTVDPVGCPVEVNVLLKPERELPAMVKELPFGNEHTPLQVMVAVVPLPVMLETSAPTNAVAV